MYYKVASSQLPAPQIAPRAEGVLETRQFSASSSTATPRTKVAASSSLTTPRTKVVLHSRQCSSPSSPDTPRPQVVLPTRQFSSSRSPATPRTTLAPPRRQFSASSSPAYKIALSRTFHALDTHDLRRGLRGHPAHRTLTCISRNRHARSPQRVARAAGTSHSRLHFAHSTRTISGDGCARTRQIALSLAFRALETHDLRRGLRALDKSHSRLHFAHSTRTISAKGCTFG